MLRVLDNVAVLNTETMNIFDVNEATCRAVQLIEAGHSREQVCEIMGCTRDELDQLMSILSQPGPEMSDEQAATFSRKRLVFMISHDCNMRCKYCYASHGTYGTGLPSMAPETAADIAQACVEKLGSYDFYMFFGGEPTLNMTAMNQVLDRLGHIASPSEFGVVTNGTFSRQLMEPLLAAGRMSMTFSLDGPKDIHNFLRTYTSSDGTFNTVVGNLLWAQDFIVPQVECTFTPDHIRLGHSLTDLIEFFAALGVNNPHIVPVSPQQAYKGFSPELLITEYKNAVDYCLDSILSGNPRSFTILGNAMMSFTSGRRREYLCPAGTTTTCVDSNGDLYPCFMFAGDASLRLGNIFEFSRDEYEERLNAFVNAARKVNREGCSQCWAMNMCSGCVGSAYWASGRLIGNDPSWCEMQRQTIGYIAAKIARFHSDKDVWQRLVEAFKNPSHDAE